MRLGDFKLAGKHYIADIAIDDKTPGGLQVVERNPRKWRIPPDAYVGIIEEVGPRCELVKVGDRATIERWTWLQLDIDDDRILGSEDHVLLVNGAPVNGVLVGILIPDHEKKSRDIILPFEENKEKLFSYYHVKIIATSVKDVEVDDELWIKKYDRDQWKLGKNKLVFRWDDPEKNQMSNIMLLKKKFDFEILS